MVSSKTQSAIFSCLEAHLAARPEHGSEDIVKFLFQALLGVGHLLGSPEQVTAYLASEMQPLSPNPSEPLAEPLGTDWVRLNLRRAKAEGMEAAQIAAKMAASAATASPYTREDVFSLCRAFAVTHAVPEDFEQEAQRVLKPDWLPSHSERYREAYAPHYRVVRISSFTSPMDNPPNT